jgi:hypothetical protein
VTVQRYVDVYHEWQSLKGKRKSGIRRFEEEIASLETKLGFAIADLQSSLATTNRTVFDTIRILRKPVNA